MMTIHAFIAGAVVCFDGKCYPALMGKETPVGQFNIRHEWTAREGYGGDVLVFREDDASMWAIHRTLPGREDAYNLRPAQRRDITEGCISVPPHVYDVLTLALDTRYASILQIHRGRPTPSMLQRNREFPRLAKAVRSPFARW
jgi:hypothetical protein